MPYFVCVACTGNLGASHLKMPHFMKTEQSYDDPRPQRPFSSTSDLLKMEGALRHNMQRTPPLQGSPRWEDMLEALTQLQSDL